MNRLILSLLVLVAFAVSSTGTVAVAQDHGHADHAEGVDHDHAAHAEEADSDHAGHDHAEGADHDHATHAEEADADHAGHDHAEHAGHDHADHAESKEFKAGDFIIHHIADAHDIHLFGDVHIPLPVILYIEGHGLKVFMSSALEGHGHGDRHYDASEGVSYTMHAEDVVDAEGVALASAGSISAAFNGQKLSVWDVSITKSVFGMLMILSIMIWMFGSIASQYKKNPGSAPKGMANALEPLILFIRDEIAKPSIGDKADKFMPFLLTSFFFIFFCNLLGLVPFLGGFNITGTIGVTIVLATLVFLLTNLNGNKHYWGHIMWPPGVPLPVKLILVPIEVFSIIMKPTVLMIRLTANISAGHIIILAFSSLIFIFGNGGEAIGAGTGMGVFSTLFMIFMYGLELLVAFLQAFVFTLLAAIYFGDATHEPAHH
jgi:F-type H+-transporting ATPase subunit a